MESPVEITPVTSTTYVVTQASKQPGTYSFATGSTSLNTLKNYDDPSNYKKLIATSNSIISKAKSVAYKTGLFYNNQSVEQIIQSHLTTPLAQDEMQYLSKVTTQNRINAQQLEETISMAQKYMNVTSIEFTHLQEPGDTYVDFFVQFTLDKSELSKTIQFNNFIDNYLGQMDITKTKIHIHVI